MSVDSDPTKCNPPSHHDQEFLADRTRSYLDWKAVSDLVIQSPWIRKTPMVRLVWDEVQNEWDLPKSEAVSSTSTPVLPDRELYFKCENMQTAGSFKLRGVVGYLNQRKGQIQGGLVSMSAGNFARALCYATQRLSVPTHLFLPDDVPADRVQAVEALGAVAQLAPRKELQQYVDRFVRESNGQYAYIHPFDDADLIAGYGSLGLEILEQVPDVDCVVAGIGGGGLLAGVAGAIRAALGNSHSRPVSIYGVEPEGAAKMKESMSKGQAVTLDRIQTFCNGLSPPFAGKRAFSMLRDSIDGVLLVNDQQIRSAILELYSRHRLVVESAGAAAYAAIRAGLIPSHHRKVVCILSGGNIAVEEMARLSLLQQT